MGSMFCSGTSDAITQLPVHEEPRLAGRSLHISKGKVEGAKSPM